MGRFLVLSTSALALFLCGSAWLLLYPALPADLGGAPNLDRAAQQVRIPVGEGDHLDGWLLPGRKPAVVLLFHGYGRDHRHTWRYGDFLSRAGYSVLTIDFRSSRPIRRKPTTLGFYELADARAALDWIRGRPALRGARIGVLGESLGGSVALVLAARAPRISALVVDCPFTTGARALEETSRRWAHLPPWPTASLIRALCRAATGCDPGALDALAAADSLWQRPILFIHATSDDRLSPGQARALWRAAGGKDPIWLAPGGHNQAWERERALYERRVLAFFDRHLLGRGPGLPPGDLPDGLARGRSVLAASAPEPAAPAARGRARTAGRAPESPAREALR